MKTNCSYHALIKSTLTFLSQGGFVKSSSFISGPGMAAHIHTDQQTMYQYSSNSRVCAAPLSAGLGKGVKLVLFILY